MILLDRLKEYHATGESMKRLLPPATIVLRVHDDVVQLAYDLAARDKEKLLATANTMFMPAVDCWFEWPAVLGDMGLLYLSGQEVKRGGGMFYAWKHAEADPTVLPMKIDLERGRIEPEHDVARLARMDKDPIVLAQSVATVAPLILAFLALINSPKVIQRQPKRLEKLNKRRLAAGRYTFHPHHVVRLNVDKKAYRVGATDGGDGASRALHFVRAHLRLWNGRYILVSPHWRGDPAIGIRKTSYEIDRQTSRWAD